MVNQPMYGIMVKGAILATMFEVRSTLLAVREDWYSPLYIHVVSSLPPEISVSLCTVANKQHEKITTIPY